MKRKVSARANSLIRSIGYTLRMYSQAVGRKRYFFWSYRLINSILPSVNALLAGFAVTRISEAITTHNFIPFLVIALVLLALQLTDMVLGQINSVLMQKAWQDVYIFISEKISRKYVEIPLALRESQDFADKFDRVKDYGATINNVSTSLIGIATAIISLISVTIATLTISPIITILVIIAAIPYSFLSLKLSKRQRRNWREFTKDRRVSYAIQQKITSSNSALEIELNELSDVLISKMIKSRRRSQDQDLKDIRKFFWPNLASRAIENITSYLILIFVAIRIILGELEIGQFMSVRSLLLQLNGNITSLFMNVASASEGLVNASDFMDFMQMTAPRDGDVKITTIPQIEFRHVSFRYPHADQNAINDVSFTISPGDSLAIVGENGAGKTTLIKLLIGAYQPSSGEILINNLPFAKINRKSYLSQIGALFQDYSRYEFATLGENVWYGDINKNYDRSRIIWALKLAGLSDFVKTFKRGLNQILSKDYDMRNATDLSGGQWQRLGIARAFFRQPGILLLDEPTSAVDAKAEYDIFKNILRQQEQRTTIIISHRFSTVRKAQKIIVLNHGAITEYGSHEDLIRQNGIYKEMFELQAEGYN